MGEACFDLSGKRPNFTHDLWLQVEATSSCPKASGSIHARVTFSLNPPPMKTRRSSVLEVEAFGGGKLCLEIVRAEGLVAKDSSLFSKEGSSDPYCKIFAKSKETQKAVLMGQTKVVKKKLSPVWNFKENFLINRTQSPEVKIIVYDYDAMSLDDPMGTLDIDVMQHTVIVGRESEEQGDLEEKTFAVEACEGCEDAKGTITIKARFIPNPPDKWKYKPFFGGLLDCTVVRGQGLLAVDRNFVGKNSSDPFVRVTTRDGRKKREELYATKHKNSNLNPKWEEKFAFMMTPYHDPMLEFGVMDYDAFSSPDPMGTVFINLHEVIHANEQHELEVTRELQPVEGCVDPKGTLTVHLKFYPNKEFDTCNGGDLKINVLGGHDLLAVDGAGLFSSRKVTTSDPFVKILIPTFSDYKLQLLSKTKVAKKNLNPKWNEEFSFIIRDSYFPVVNLQVMDHDMGSGSDPMGCAYLQLCDVKSEPTPLSLDVLPCKGCFGATGKIDVVASYTPNPAPRIEEFYGGKLVVTVMEAEGLLAVDSDGMFGGGFGSRGGSSDPYVKLQGTKLVRGKKKTIETVADPKMEKSIFTDKLMNPKTKVETFDKTKVIKKNLNPRWNQRLGCTLSADHLSKVVFAIYDHDMVGGDDPMGVVEIELTTLEDTEDDGDEFTDTVDDWYEVKACKGCSAATGRLHLKIIWVPECSPEEKRRRLEEAKKKMLGETESPERDLTLEEVKEEAKRRMRELARITSFQYYEENANEESKKVLNVEGELHKYQRRNSLEYTGKPRDSTQDEIDEILNSRAFQERPGKKLIDEEMMEAMVKQQKGSARGTHDAAVKTLKSAFARRATFQMNDQFVGAALEHRSQPRERQRGIAFMLKQPRAKTPLLKVSRLVSVKNSSEKYYDDPKQEYSKLIKGVEARFKKKNKLMVNLETVSKFIPRNPSHSLNVLNATARDEPIKHMAADMQAADIRFHNKQDAFRANFTKFKPLFNHPLPTGRPRFDCEKLMKRLNNLSRGERAAAAAFWGNAWCIEEIYMQDCPVNTTNSTGFTPLHIACRFNYKDCVHCLLNIGLEPSSGVDVNAETESYLTPMRVAIASGAVDCIELLTAAGGVDKILREKTGFRSILDMDEVLKYKWPNKRDGDEEGDFEDCAEPDDYLFKRSTDRAIDNKAANLGRQSIYYMYT